MTDERGRMMAASRSIKSRRDTPEAAAVEPARPPVGREAYMHQTHLIEQAALWLEVVGLQKGADKADAKTLRRVAARLRARHPEPTQGE
jgi:hypothetical protein